MWLTLWNFRYLSVYSTFTERFLFTKIMWHICVFLNGLSRFLSQQDVEATEQQIDLVHPIQISLAQTILSSTFGHFADFLLYFGRKERDV